VIIVVRRDIVDKVVIKAYIDLTDHLYFIILDIIKQERYTRVVNYYNNQLRPLFIYIGTS
jgi:hypothetical protein